MKQALRANRDRERTNLRAMIAQKRKTSGGKDGIASGTGISGEVSEDTPRKLDGVREWGSPSGWVARSPVEPKRRSPKAAASEPPPRPRRFRSPNIVSPRQRVPVGGIKVRLSGSASAGTFRRRRRPRSNNENAPNAAEPERQGSPSSKVARYAKRWLSIVDVVLFFCARSLRLLGGCVLVCCFVGFNAVLFRTEDSSQRKKAWSWWRMECLPRFVVWHVRHLTVVGCFRLSYSACFAHDKGSLSPRL